MSNLDFLNLDITSILSMTHIEISEMFYEPDDFAETTPIKYLHQVDFEHQIDTENNILSTKIMHCIHPEGMQQHIAKLSAVYTFSIHNMEAIFNEKTTSEKDLNYQIIQYINHTCISTHRGLVFSFLKGTPLHFAILPIGGVEKS